MLSATCLQALRVNLELKHHGTVLSAGKAPCAARTAANDVNPVEGSRQATCIIRLAAENPQGQNQKMVSAR
jgi:hypothetical protein